MKITSRIMAAMFFFFAFLQINDPDPVLWCSLYLVPSAVSLLKIRSRLVLGIGLCYAALSVWWWNYAADGPSCGELFGKINWPDFIGHETVRESLGLGIVAAWLLALAAWKKKKDAH
jgi:hypothetical protein